MVGKTGVGDRLGQTLAVITQNKDQEVFDLKLVLLQEV